MPRPTRRVWIRAVVAAAVSATLAVAVNVATDLRSSVVAWVAVVALTLSSALVAAAVEPAPGKRRGADPAGPWTARVETTNVHLGSARQVVQAQSVGAVQLGLSVRTVTAVGAVVFLVAAGTIATQAVVERVGAPPPAGGAAPAGSGQAGSAQAGGRDQPGADGPASAGGPPFTVSADAENGLCSTWVTGQDPARIDAALPVPEEVSSYGEWADWAPVADGAAASGHLDGPRVPALPDYVSFTVQGTSPAQAVTLTGLAVRVVGRRPPLPGIVLSRQCGDAGAYRWFAVNLDDDPPSVSATLSEHLAPEDTPPERRTPVRFPYTVSLADPESFTVHAVTLDCDCDWVIDLEWTSAGRRGVHTIQDPRGRPFRTSSVSAARPCYLGDRVECPDSP